jgi:hypothetical protein
MPTDDPLDALDVSRIDPECPDCGGEGIVAVLQCAVVISRCCGGCIDEYPCPRCYPETVDHGEPEPPDMPEDPDAYR